ncbi:sugar isomerase domain-containing protein [Dongshaea marina]|uniref:sugar isomerase domain-containing protein n=1 Tax=Dongshaea marina TaxID=2047966 RepID=UPI00131ED2DF|nr:sugar isomerase domain-containing protein [Dongshaea marina]
MRSLFSQKALSRLEQLVTDQHESISQAAELFSRAIIEDKIIWAFGTGHSHMLPMELFARAGGLANIGAMLDESILNGSGARRSSDFERLPGTARVIWDRYQPGSGDLMLIASNSGLNAAPVEMAMLAREHGLKTIAITSVSQSSANQARHPSGKKLMALTDLILDNYAPDGDGLVELEGLQTGSFSSLAGIFLIQTLVVEAIALCQKKQHPVPLFQSQNQDQPNQNQQLFEHYQQRVLHL